MPYFEGIGVKTKGFRCFQGEEPVGFEEIKHIKIVFAREITQTMTFADMMGNVDLAERIPKVSEYLKRCNC